MAVSLESGSVISHYRILSPLGSGGMGEVYLAHDKTLERSIALKILPAELVANEERVRRFVQEAKSASSLSHPHIVTIHEIGQAEVELPAGRDKIDSGPIYYIAMELIDGDTLRSKIHRDRTDLKKILGYLAQAAEGLAKAHAAGIIHRDLKPDNIMITKDGYAKVLDFGLAKLQRRDVDGGSESPEGATAVKEKTREGVVMGTIGYMSPEQVQGQVADHRSDIFSFGCILYEAAARKRPFTGDSDVDVMHKILHDKPEALDQTHPEVPAELRRIIRRCLAKEPEKRYQSMKDLALEVGELFEEYDELSKSGDSKSNSSISAPAIALAAKRRPFMTLGIVAAVFVVLAGVAFVGWKLAARPGKETSGSFSSMTMTKLTTSGHVTLGAISPDGRYVAHVVEDRGLQGLSVRQVATGADIQVVPPASMRFRGVTFSPDGNYLDYVRGESEGSIYSVLYQIPSLGGTPRKLVFDVDTAVTFSPDGKRLAFVRGYPHVRESAVVVANADGSGEKKLAIRKQPSQFPNIKASWSPDGKTIAVIGNDVDGGAHTRVVVVDTTTGKEQAVGTSRWSGLSGVAWLPDGSGLAVTGQDKNDAPSSQVWLISYPAGDVRKITNDLNNYFSASTTSDGKTIATIQASGYGNIWAVSAEDPATLKQRTSGTQETVNTLATMPDGSIVFEAFTNGISNLWVLDPTGSRKQLTFDQNQNFNPSVSADGKTIVFGSLRESLPHVFKMDANGGSPVQLTSGKGEFGASISPDGTWIVYQSVDGGVWRASSAGGAPQRLVESSSGFGPSISPDGSMLNYSTIQAGTDRARDLEIVIPSGGGNPIRTFEIEGGFAVQWSPGGDALDYVLNTQGVSNIWRQPMDGSPRIQLTKFDDGTIDWFAWAADGKTLVIARSERIQDVVLIGNFQ